MTDIKVLSTIIVDLAIPPNPLNSKIKREIILQNIDDLRRIAIRLSKGIIYRYTLEKDGKIYDVFEAEAKYAIFRVFEQRMGGIGYEKNKKCRSICYATP